MIKEIIELKDIEKIETLTEPVRKGYRYVCVIGKGVFRIIENKFRKFYMEEVYDRVR